MIDQQLSDSLDSRGDVETDKALARIRANGSVMVENESAAQNSQEVAAAAAWTGRPPYPSMSQSKSRSAGPSAGHTARNRRIPDGSAARRAPLDPMAVEDMIREAIENAVNIWDDGPPLGLQAELTTDIIKIELDERDGIPFADTMQICKECESIIVYDRPVRYTMIGRPEPKYDTTSAIIVTYDVEPQ